MKKRIKMKQNIRRGVWETNSSSTHSIHIDDSVELLDTLIPDEEGVITLHGDEFGWEVESYNDSMTKANYLTLCMGDENHEKMEIFIETIKEHTGAKEIVMNFDGYVDHGNEHGVLADSTTDKKTLKNYLFNKKSWLFTTNDNCDTCWKIDEHNNAMSYESNY